MANTKTKSSSTTKSTDETKEPEKKFSPKDIDQSQYVPVLNGFHGRLVYITREGEKYVWEDYGDEQEMELRELRNAKAAHKVFFESNWFMFDDDYSWVIDYLGVGGFYKHALSVDGFDDIFKKSPSELKKLIGEMSKGQALSVSYRARQLILSGEIDSLKTIDALEEALHTEFVDRLSN